MRPKVAQRPWQRRACQCIFYSLWPLLLLWAVYSYPSSGGSGGTTLQQPSEASTRSRAERQRGAHGPNDGSSGSSSSSHLDPQHGEAATELSDTDTADWQLPKNTATGNAQQQQLEKGVTVGGGDGSSGSTQDADGRVYSSATVYAVRNGNGNFAKYYYKFSNVRLTRKALYFYMPPGMAKPAEHWVDFISGNATHTGLPTMIVIKGEVQRQKWFYLPVRYTTSPSRCTSWTAKPTYFLQVRYSYNIWHTWDEGLMGVFQTLREQGLLPLVQVDQEGNMREVTEGLSKECPTIFDPEINGTRPETDCVQRLDVVRETKCDIKNQAWCRPGVVSYRRFDGPVILPYTAAAVMNRWAQVYDAMTTDVRDFSLVDGHCFKSLIVGKTNTLNFYQAANMTAITREHIRERIAAMAVFKEFVKTAQREFVAAERQKNPEAVEFRGYVNPKLERLRRGIGPEHIDLVEYIAPGEVPGLLREELPQLKELWSKRREEMAKIDAEWEAGNKVVSLADSQDGEEGGSGSSKNIRSSGGGSNSDAKRRHLLLQSEADGSSSSDGSLVASSGEGAQRRLPRQPLRTLLRKGGRKAGAAAVADEADGDSMADGGSGDGDGGDALVQQAEQLAEEQDSELSGSGPAGARAAADGGDGDEAAEAVAEAAEREAVLKAMPVIIHSSDDFSLEKPRPVVTYMSRNFFSRGVLNEHDVLRYILSNYNVTLRVTTFEEPLLEAMELMQHTDVLVGMHGAGWTNGMFIKHTAVTLQMYPYGWRLPDKSTIRGYNYREIVLASECPYLEWVSPRWDYAFFRRIDFNRRVKMEYVLHPDPNGPHPVDGWPGNPWIYQNTYVDMAHFGPYIDRAMETAGIQPVANPIPVSLN